MTMLKNINTQLNNIRLDHKFWINELVLAEQEIIRYEDQIIDFFEIYTEGNKQDELGILLIEFIQLRKTAEAIRNKIKKHIVNMNRKIKGNGAFKAIINSEHKASREWMENFRTDFAALKVLFHRFTAESTN